MDFDLLTIEYLEYRIRGPVITFNSMCLIVGFVMLGFADQVAVRYVGVFLATGAYVSNWAALNSYQANNITGYVCSRALYQTSAR